MQVEQLEDRVTPSMTWSSATDISGDSDVKTNGTLVDAWYFPYSGTASTTVNGVTFTGESAAGQTSISDSTFNLAVASGTLTTYNGSTSAAPFSGLSSSYQTLLGPDVYTFPSQGNLTLTMSGLTVGHQYEFQWWDNLSNTAGNLFPQTATDVNSVTLSSNTSSSAGGLGQFAVGTFTATGSTETVTFTNTSNNGNINAFQLRDVSVPSTPINKDTTTGTSISYITAVPGEYVGLTAYSTDSAGAVNYSFTSSGSGGGYFAINPASGKVTLSPAGGSITPGVYALTVQASNGGVYSSPATFDITATLGASLTVTTTQDDPSGPIPGQTTLRDAITLADEYPQLPNVITFATNVTGTINLGSQLRAITGNVTIQGPGANVLAIDGQGNGSVFTIDSGTAAINGLAITGGIGNGNGSEGGGVFINSGTVSLANDVITNNTADFGGGLGNFGTTTLTNDTIANNYTEFNGGGVFNYTGGTMTVVNSTITGNRGTFGGGIFNANSSTIATLLTLLNDTITANTASSSGGGIWNGNVGSSSGYATVQDIFDTIVDGNTIGGSTGSHSADIYNSSGNVFTSQGGNLYGDETGSETVNVAWITSGSYKDVADKNDNPGLGALQFNGGPTPTMAELPGSPALQAGLLTGSGGATPPATDQRGFPRTSNGSIDSGAYQNQSQLFLTQTAPSNTGSYFAGVSSLFNLGSFTYSGGQTTWSVDVNWGDGTADTQFTTTQQGTLPQKAHTYAVAGVYTLTVTISDGNNNFTTASASVRVGGVITVNTTADTTAQNPSLSPLDSHGNISLRSAIQFADRFPSIKAPITIEFAPNVVGTISLGSELPDISNGNLTIQGPGAGVLTVNANSHGVVFGVDEVTAAISGLTITGGFASYGAGIYQTQGNLTLTNDIITGNEAGTNGGGIYNTGGTLTLIDCTLDANSSAGDSGAIFSTGTTDIINSTIAGNTATDLCAGICNEGTMDIVNSTLTGNIAGTYGCIYNITGTLTITNSTIDGNTATGPFPKRGQQKRLGIK